jgi:hypothetical protein
VDFYIATCFGLVLSLFRLIYTVQGQLYQLSRCCYFRTWDYYVILLVDFVLGVLYELNTLYMEIMSVRLCANISD